MCGGGSTNPSIICPLELIRSTMPNHTTTVQLRDARVRGHAGVSRAGPPGACVYGCGLMSWIVRCVGVVQAGLTSPNPSQHPPKTPIQSNTAGRLRRLLQTPRLHPRRGGALPAAARLRDRSLPRWGADAPDEPRRGHAVPRCAGGCGGVRVDFGRGRGVHAGGEGKGWG